MNDRTVKLVRVAVGTKAADELREEADRLLLASRQTQFNAAMRLGGKHTQAGLEELANAELLRIDAKQREEEAAGARRRANWVAWQQASAMLREARATKRRR